MAGIANDISELYLNEELSDFRIIIGNENLPAHRTVLGKRCPYFKNMFKSGMSEVISKRIELHETPITSFKTVFKWIYTAEIQLEHVSDALDVLRLAHMYGMMELVTLVIKYLKKECAVDNVFMILNASVLLSLDKLTDIVVDFVDDKLIKVLEHDNFEHLSKDALCVVLTDLVSTVPDVCIFRAVIRWMKANSSNAVDFPDVLKNVPLEDIALRELKTVPSDVIDANVLVKATVKQHTAGVPCRKLRDQNVAVPKYGVKVLTGGETVFFSNSGKVLKHTVGMSEEGIVVALGHCFKLNSFKMQLVEAGRKDFSYWIDVSEDNVSWTRVIDHSKYACRSLQKLYFKERLVRYIRICGTAPRKEVFKISSFEALYTTEPFKIDSETTLSIPSYNVALAEKNAITIEGDSIPENALIDGSFDGYNYNHGYTWLNIGMGIIIQLPQPYLIDTMKLLLWDGDDRVYSYNVEVSVDQVKWMQVVFEEKVASWRKIHLHRQPVVFVKLTGTFNSVNDAFCVVYLECYARECVKRKRTATGARQSDRVKTGRRSQFSRNHFALFRHY
uniref:BTB domain-containing protein n=1 Tax=Panagrellus redivivus TaxID=6233 RepID=A0A7E4ZWG8_PANRE